MAATIAASEEKRREPALPGQSEGDAGRRRDAFTACEMMENRIQVSDKNGKRGSRGSERCVAPAGTQVIREHDGGKPLDAVAEERQQRGCLVAGAQHISRARVARAIAARVRQSAKLAYDHRKIG